MKDLNKIIKEKYIQLLIWYFDGVVSHLDWRLGGSLDDLFTELFKKISQIDNQIIKDKDSFFSNMYPYPEINKVGELYGSELQNQVKQILYNKEKHLIDYAIANQDVVSMINELKIPQVIWSNNGSELIKKLLNTFGVADKISLISSLDTFWYAKPNIDGYARIHESFPEIQAKQVLFVGDSLRSDKAAADQIGINFYHYQNSKR